VFTGGLLGLVGSFPPQYMGVVFSGQAIGGIFASATNVLVIAMGADPVYSAFFCFLIAVVFLASALVFFVIVTRSEFYQYYLGEQVPTKEQITESGDEAELSGKFLQDNTEVIILPVKVNPLLVLGKISLYAASVFSIFVVTLACFPAVTVLVVSTGLAEGGQWSTVYFIPVACFLLFNVGDLIGRFSAQYLQWPKPGRLGMIIVFALSMARLAFIPLFLVCNAKPGGRHVTDVYFYSDLAYIIVMSLFSVTNGYLANICMMSAPQVCKGPEAQTAASIMVALLGLGLGTGALMSYPVQMLL
jgi:equilibrative nucleoside transporter 1/2/3